MMAAKLLSQAEYCKRLTDAGILAITAETSYRAWRATVYAAVEGIQRGSSAGWRETRSRSQAAALRAVLAWWRKLAP